MTTAVQLFHSLPPIASLPTATVPAAKSSAGARNQPASLHVVCASRKSRDDDYHATLKALNSKGRFPRKSLGQHYMLNPEINEQLARAANVEEGDVVLEIGPGTGSLTNVLINSGATVLAIEKDPHMVDLVRERFETTDKFKEETAVRLVESSLRTSEYRLINVFVNFYSEPEYNFRVPRKNFFPQPNVHSAFNGKRKMLRRSLQHICPSNEIERALGDAGLPTTVSFIGIGTF
ncbi:putative dimethyladenosine transferase [Gossypium australe]|uniref:rRNA adenine N(6)-methyltransferase n=1 Tax=Gossypium australe TaxID=47621 RepID=A0A5B6W0C2_9ROSI|nr:putative dimethyladenosine transferase [Gossypium australe]